jgi:hypothetical protein
MVDIGKLFFLYFTINSIRSVSLVSIQELTKNDIIIDITKGYALRRIGAYSPTVVEQIVHTFIPLNQFCVTSPTADVCLYTSLSEKSNVVELATLMTSNQSIHTSPSHDSDSVSELIGNDIIRVLAQHREIIRNNKSIVHVIDNQFHYQKTDEKALTTASLTNVIDNYPSIVHLRRSMSVEIILKQINNNKIGFEYLSSTDLKLFLTAIFSTIDTSYTVSNIQESLNIFVPLIVGQSVFVLRYCSFNQHTSLPSQPCLAISTLFLRTPIHSASIFSIYYLIPLPTIFNNDRYVYSNLPKIIGINSMNQRLIMWNDESDINQCTFLPVVQCQRTPISMPISKSSCLSQLFNDNQSLTTMCQVSRSQNIDQDVVYIDNNIWLFNNIQHAQHCHIYSRENELVETITINEPAIVSIPCNKKIAWMNFQLSVSSCSQRRSVIISGVASNIRNLPNFIVSIQNITKTLLSSYESQLERSMNELFTTFRSKQSRFKLIMHDFASYILSVVFFILLIMVLYIFKLIRYKVQRGLDSLESLVFQMIRV